MHLLFIKDPELLSTKGEHVGENQKSRKIADLVERSSCSIFKTKPVMN